MSDELPASRRGLTVRETARLLRIGTSKVLSWIKKGELAAVNTSSSLCGRPRWIILPDALIEFQRRRQGGSPAKRTRRKKRTPMIDFYPD